MNSTPSGNPNPPVATVEQTLPYCTWCGGSDVRRSQSRHLFDGLARTFGFKPYRCRGCRARFFAK